MTEKDESKKSDVTSQEYEQQVREFWNDFYSMTYDCLLEVLEERKKRELAEENSQKEQEKEK